MKKNKTKTAPEKTNKVITKKDTKKQTKSKLYLAFIDGIIQTNCFVFILFLITSKLTEGIKFDVNFILSALVTVFSIFLFYLFARSQTRKSGVVLFSLYSAVTFIATLTILLVVYMIFPFGPIATEDIVTKEGALTIMISVCFLATSVVFKLIIAFALWFTRKK